MTRNELSRLMDKMDETLEVIYRLDERMKALPPTNELAHLISIYPDLKRDVKDLNSWKYMLLGAASVLGTIGAAVWEFVSGMVKG